MSSKKRGVGGLSTVIGSPGLRKRLKAASAGAIIWRDGRGVNLRQWTVVLFFEGLLENAGKNDNLLLINVVK